MRSLFLYEYRDVQGRWFGINPLLAETERLSKLAGSAGAAMTAPHSNGEILAHNRAALTELERSIKLRPERFSLVLAKCNYSRLRGIVTEHLQKNRRSSRTGSANSRGNSSPGHCHPGTAAVSPGAIAGRARKCAGVGRHH